MSTCVARALRCGAFICAAIAAFSSARASTISILTSPPSFTETDFIDLFTVASNVSNSIHSPLTSTTNGGVSFTLTQSNSNPLGCATGGGCLRYDQIDSNSNWAVHGFDTFSPMTLDLGSGFGDVAFNGIASRSTTFSIQVTHGGVQDAAVQITPNGSLVFVGVQSTANDITQVILSVSGSGFNGILNGDYSGMGRVSLATAGAASVPEPGTFGLMLGAGALVLGVRRYRSRKA